MKSLPSLLRRFIARLLILALPITTLPAPLHAAEEIRLPEIGDSSGGVMTPSEEQRLGDAFMRQVRARMKLADDPLAIEYLQSLGRDLVSNSDSPGLSFDFFLVVDPEVNAFAGPAGHIGVNTGLILTTQSENELASVMAHEIAHVTQRHINRAIESASNMGVTTAALLLAAILVGVASDNSNVGQAAVAGVQAGITQHQINFTRNNEEEADRVGISILAASGYDPNAMPNFFDRLGAKTRLYDDGTIPEFLRTHPVTTNRIADSRGRAESYPYRQRPDSLEYHLLRARLKEMEFRQPQDAITHFQTTLEQGRYRNEDAQRYGLALALMRGQKFSSAEKELDKLLRSDPLRSDYVVARAELLKRTRRPEEARRTLKNALDLHPGNYALSSYYADALLAGTRYGEARSFLEEMVRRYPDDARLLRSLGNATGKSGDPMLGQLYLAEANYQSGQLETAVQQLDTALRNRNIEYFVSAKMAARLKEMRQELKELKDRK